MQKVKFGIFDHSAPTFGLSDNSTTLDHSNQYDNNGKHQ
jgi:hypothetical protein